MNIKLLIDFLPGVAVIISFIGLFGNFWQNRFANRLRVIEKTDEVIERFETNIVVPFNRITDLIEREISNELKHLKIIENEDSDYQKRIFESVYQLHSKDILRITNEMNRLTLLLETKYVNETKFLAFTNPDLKLLIDFFKDKQNDFDISLIKPFLKTIKYNGGNEIDF